MIRHHFLSISSCTTYALGTLNEQKSTTYMLGKSAFTKSKKCLYYLYIVVLELYRETQLPHKPNAHIVD